MSLIDIFQKWKLNVFLLSFFLLRIPPIYIFPPLKNAFLTTQSLARVFFLGIFLFELHLLFKGQGGLKNLYEKNKLVLILLFLFFFVLSLGVFYAANTREFLLRYKDIFLGLVMFFLGAVFGKKINKLAKVIILGMVFSFLYQLVMFAAPSAFSNIAGYVVYDRHLGLVLDNLARGRLYIEVFDEALLLIPVIWFYSKFPKKARLYSTLLFVAVAFFAFVSNFRSRVLVLAISFLGYLFFELKKTRKLSFAPRKEYFGYLVLVLTLVFSAFLAEVFARRAFGFSFVDRLMFSDVKEDVETVNFRITQLGEAWDMGKASYGLGVGLGNYYDNLSFSKTYPLFFSLTRNVTIKGAAEYVHNIFGTILAEGGLWVTLIFSTLVVKFAADDLRLLKKKERGQALIIFSFWGLFVYSFFNPFVPFTLQGLFWFTRGMLAENSAAFIKNAKI